MSNFDLFLRLMLGIENRTVLAVPQSKASKAFSLLPSLQPSTTIWSRYYFASPAMFDVISHHQCLTLLLHVISEIRCYSFTSLTTFDVSSHVVMNFASVLVNWHLARTIIKTDRSTQRPATYLGWALLSSPAHACLKKHASVCGLR